MDKRVNIFEALQNYDASSDESSEESQIIKEDAIAKQSQQKETSQYIKTPKQRLLYREILEIPFNLFQKNQILNVGMQTMQLNVIFKKRRGKEEILVYGKKGEDRKKLLKQLTQTIKLNKSKAVLQISKIPVNLFKKIEQLIYNQMCEYVQRTDSIVIQGIHCRDVAKQVEATICQYYKNEDVLFYDFSQILQDHVIQIIASLTHQYPNFNGLFQIIKINNKVTETEKIKKTYRLKFGGGYAFKNIISFNSLFMERIKYILKIYISFDFLSLQSFDYEFISEKNEFALSNRQKEFPQVSFSIKWTKQKLKIAGNQQALEQAKKRIQD